MYEVTIETDFNTSVRVQRFGVVAKHKTAALKHVALLLAVDVATLADIAHVDAWYADWPIVVL